MIAETLREQNKKLATDSLQWSRDLVIAETFCGADLMTALDGLQWSRDLVIAETETTSAVYR